MSRTRDVLDDTVKLVATGARHATVAALLGVSPAAVDQRMCRIGHRLGTSNAVGTVVACLRRGWLTLDELTPEVLGDR